MAFDKKTKRDVIGITALGVGLGVATKVEAVAKPPIPIVTQFAPIASTAGIVIGAGTVLRQLKRLPTMQRPVPIKSLNKARMRIEDTKRKGFKRRFL